MNTLTFPQLELWVHLAIQQRNQNADLIADKVTENALALLEKLKIIKRG